MTDPDFTHYMQDWHYVTQYTTNDYTLSSSGSGPVAAVTQSNGSTIPGTQIGTINGVFRVQTGSTAGNYATVQNKVVDWLLDPTIVPFTHPLQSSKKLWFECNLALSAGVGSSGGPAAFIGLSETQNSGLGLSQ